MALRVTGLLKFDKFITHVTYSAVLLLLMSKGVSICLGLQLVHLLHGSANWPLPVSMITDCAWGG